MRLTVTLMVLTAALARGYPMVGSGLEEIRPGLLVYRAYGRSGAARALGDDDETEGSGATEHGEKDAAAVQSSPPPIPMLNEEDETKETGEEEAPIEAPEVTTENPSPSESDKATETIIDDVEAVQVNEDEVDDSIPYTEEAAREEEILEPESEEADIQVTPVPEEADAEVQAEIETAEAVPEFPEEPSVVMVDATTVTANSEVTPTAAVEPEDAETPVTVLPTTVADETPSEPEQAVTEPILAEETAAVSSEALDASAEIIVRPEGDLELAEPETTEVEEELEAFPELPLDIAVQSPEEAADIPPSEPEDAVDVGEPVPAEAAVDVGEPVLGDSAVDVNEPVQEVAVEAAEIQPEVPVEYAEAEVPQAEAGQEVPEAEAAAVEEDAIYPATAESDIDAPFVPAFAEVSENAELVEDEAPVLLGGGELAEAPEETTTEKSMDDILNLLL